MGEMRALCLLCLVCAACAKKPAPKAPAAPSTIERKETAPPPSSVAPKPAPKMGDPCDGGQKPR